MIVNYINHLFTTLTIQSSINKMINNDNTVNIIHSQQAHADD